MYLHISTGVCRVSESMMAILPWFAPRVRFFFSKVRCRSIRLFFYIPVNVSDSRPASALMPRPEAEFVSFGSGFKVTLKNNFPN